MRWGGYGGGGGLAARIAACGEHCSFAYDALGTRGRAFQGAIGRQSFKSLAELRKGPHERQAVQVDLSVFGGAGFPDKPLTEYAPPDLRPREGTAVVDKALPLPNVNDGFRGVGPDIGAYEAGGEMPHYGPRTRGQDEETMPGK